MRTTLSILSWICVLLVSLILWLDLHQTYSTVALRNWELGLDIITLNLMLVLTHIAPRLADPRHRS